MIKDGGWRMLVTIVGMVGVAAVSAAGGRAEKLEFVEYNQCGYDVYRSPVDGARMVRIPAGEFRMGSSDADVEWAVQQFRDPVVCFQDEQPVRTVYVSDFCIDEHEVTNRQFRCFVDETGYHTDLERWTYCIMDTPDGLKKVEGVTWEHPCGPGSGIVNRMDHPVVRVSWNDARAYASWAGKRLPTEAEWEKAARGGRTGTHFPWGDELPDAYQANFSGRYSLSLCDRPPVDDGFDETAPVASFPANGYGLYDMAGNVAEWCFDWYDGSYYSIAPANDPKGPETEPPQRSRVIRGGSWYHVAGWLRCADRCSGFATDTYELYLGFRCARDIK